jgi:predicted nucleic acid-binding protein
VRRVFVDTSALFPFSVMDLFLALTEDAVHQVLWTDELLEEWERVIVREQRRSSDTAASVVAAIRDTFEDCRIDPSRYRHLVDSMPGADPDDHPHAAAAVGAGVDALITHDSPGFPVDAMAALGVRVVDPDTYLVELLDEESVEVTATLMRIAKEKTRPAMSPQDVLEALRRAGLDEFPRRIESRL